ncbi:MAG TPA: DUF3592 domain-containing protein [Planctomycetota bacterium]|nr:DUF3592 domain-containing protein [Planctomycetota bacterium]
MRLGWLVGLGAVAALVLAAAALFAIRASSSWPATHGVVLRSELRELVRRSPWRPGEIQRAVEYEAIVEYQYEIDGVRHASNGILASGPSVLPKRDASDLVSRFGAGSPVTVYYDPDDPTRACLIPGSAFPPMGYVALIGVFLLAGAVVAGAVFLLRR